MAHSERGYLYNTYASGHCATTPISGVNPEMQLAITISKVVCFLWNEYRILRHLARGFQPSTSIESVKPLHLLRFFIKHNLRSNHLKAKHTFC